MRPNRAARRSTKTRFILTSFALTVTALVGVAPATAIAAQPWCDPAQHDPDDPPPDPPPTCGTTVIRGSSPGRVRVELPQEAVIAPLFTGSDPDVSIQGEGAFVGIVLRQESTTPGEPAAGLFAGLLPKKPAAYSEGAASPYVFENLSAPSELGPVTLPAGNYWLYLLADGHQVEVKLRFRSLEGSTSLAVTEEVSFDARKIWPNVKVGDSLFMGTDTDELESRGLLLGVLWTTGESIPPGWGTLGHRSQLCLYQGEPPESEEMNPACPSASFVAGHGNSGLTQAWQTSLLSINAPAGVWGWTAYYVNPGLPDDAAGVAAWVSYDPVT